MVHFICGNCRVFLFKENEEEKDCIDHPQGPKEWVYVEDKTEPSVGEEDAI
jgi:hypothetical protein